MLSYSPVKIFISYFFTLPLPNLAKGEKEKGMRLRLCCAVFHSFFYGVNQLADNVKGRFPFGFCMKIRDNAVL